MVEAMDRLRQERIERSEAGAMGEAFGVQVSKEGSLSLRWKYKDRRRELSDGISIEPCGSIYALAHELIHALPIEVLMAELAALPYRNLGEIEGQSPSFAEAYHHLLNHAYQDEAISNLGEVILHRDMKAAEIPLEAFIDPTELSVIQAMAEVYEQAGPTGFIRSELYIGRNHRSSYSVQRIAQAALLATLNPALLADPSLGQVLLEQGIQLEGQGKLASYLGEIDLAGGKISLGKVTALLSRLRADGIQIQIDPAQMVANCQEALALMTGARQRASVSFLGQAQETRCRVELMAEIRRRFENYRRQFEKALEKAKAKRAKKSTDSQSIDAAKQAELPSAVERAREEGEYFRGLREEEKRYERHPPSQAEASKTEVKHYKRQRQELARTKKRAAWQDFPGLVSLYRQIFLLSRGAEAEERTTLGHLAQEVHDFLVANIHPQSLHAGMQIWDDKLPQIILGLEAARWSDQFERITVEDMRTSLCLLFDSLGHVGQLNVQPFVFRIVVEAMTDPKVRGLITTETLSQLAKEYKDFHLSTEIDEEYYTETLSLLADFMQNLASLGSISALLPRHELVEGGTEAKKGAAELIDWECFALQAAYACGSSKPSYSPFARVDYFSRDFLPEHVHVDVQTEYEGKYAQYKNLPDFDSILRYQRDLFKIRSGRDFSFKNNSEKGEREGNLQIPTLFWLGDASPHVSVDLPLYPPHPDPHLPQAVIAQEGGHLQSLHLALEALEREASLREIPHSLKKAAEVELGRDLTDPGTRWVATQLAIRWARLAASCGDQEWAVSLLDEHRLSLHSENLEILADHSLDENRMALELAQRLLPLAVPGEFEAKQNALRELREEYETTIHLRRSGYSPALIAACLSCWVRESELRPALLDLLQSAVDHTANFDIHTPTFRSGVAALLVEIDEGNLTHQDKDALLVRLLSKTLPDRSKAKATLLSPRKKLEAFQWFQDLVLSDEVLDRLALYPGAESVLLARTQEVLAEVGTVPLSLEMEGKLLGLTTRLTRWMQQHHPEILDAENADRLGRVSDDPHYQLALATVFPSRQVLVDTELPVDRWSPVMVRKGLQDRAQAWERLRETLEGDTGEDVERTQRALRVLEAFVLHEVESSGQRTDVLKEAMDLFQAFEQRSRVSSSNSVRHGAATALTLYSRALRVMSRQDQVFLENLTQIPAVSWAMGWTEEAWNAGRAMNPVQEEIWQAILATPTVSDAVRKRELCLLVLAEERFPLTLRRRAALALAHGSASGSTFESLITGYQANQEEAAEGRFYNLIAAYWQRVGQLPDPAGTLLLVERAGQDPDIFWSDFERILRGESGGEVTELALELRALRQGKYGDRFLTEVNTALTSAQPTREALVFRDEIARFLPAAGRAKLVPRVRAVQLLRLEREERLQIISRDLPPAFLRQPAEIRFLLLKFLEEMPQVQVQSLVRELRDLSETAGDAEVFRRFFLRVGLEKGGQFLSTMVGTVPDADRAIYAVLQDKVPPSSFAEVRATVAKELGQALEEIFSEFEEEPVASASMGEVYRAKLKAGGTKVYAKISTPSKRAQTQMAVQTLLKVADAYEAEQDRFEAIFDIPGQIRFFAKQLQRQLDFKNERKNALSIGGYEAGEYRIPEFIMDFSTDHITIMLPAPGVKVTELEDPQERAQAAEQFADDALNMLADGRYHADPHPANEFWDTVLRRLTWLDWGVVDHLNYEAWKKTMALPLAVALGDTETKLSALRAASSRATEDRFAALRADLSAGQATGSVGEQLNQFLNLAGRKHRIYLDPEIMRAIAFLSTVEGVVKELNPTQNFAADVLRVFAKRRR
jgi:hypothetical protein